MAANDLLMGLIRTELMDIAGSEDVSVSEVDKYAYSTDVYWVPRMWLDRLQRPTLPDFIVHPESAAEVSRILKVANRFRLPVIPYGGGSGSQGGTVPLFGGIMLDLKKMNKIIRIDEKSLTVTAQAGINGQVLEWELNRHGLTLAHYPASEYGATLAAAHRRRIVVKRGAAGCLLFDAEGHCVLQVPACQVEAVDPTGAGDAFCGGVLAGLCRFGDLKRALACGTVSASFAVEGDGISRLVLADPDAAERRLRHIEQGGLEGS